MGECQNIDKMCRACLTIETREVRSLFKKHISDMFIYCTNIKVMCNDGLPSQLCIDCHDKLNSFYAFKHLCAKSDEELQSSKKIKLLDVDDNKIINTDPQEIIYKESNSIDIFNDDFSESYCESNISCNKSPLKKDNEVMGQNENTQIEDISIIDGKMNNFKTCKKIKYKCDVCDKWFFQIDKLEGHLRTHQGKKPAVCKICNNEFRNWNGLRQHKLLHEGIKKYSCKVCKKSFSYSTGLKMHEKIHTGIKSKFCEKCGKAFKTKGELKCPNCTKAFKTRVRYKVHLMRCSGQKNFVCSICGKRAAVKQDLETHMRTHSGERPFPCDSCHKKFTTQSNLASHRRSHSGEKPYTCHVCSLTFAVSGALKNHRLTHTGERPHVCSVCGKRFAQASSLKSHNKQHVSL